MSLRVCFWRAMASMLQRVLVVTSQGYVSSISGGRDFRSDSSMARIRVMIEMSMLVLFAHAGTFKPLGWVQALPVDLTLLSAAVVLVAVIARASRVRSVPVEYGIVGLFFLAMAPALSNPAASPYASEKPSTSSPSRSWQPSRRWCS